MRMPADRDNATWELSEAELRSFFSRIDNEKATMNLGLEQAQDAHVIVAARENGKIAGIAGVRRARGLPVAFFIVLEPFQGRGIGKALLRRLHSALLSKGSHLVCLSVLRNNQRALALYRNHGYRTFYRNAESYYMFRLLFRD